VSLLNRLSALWRDLAHRHRVDRDFDAEMRAYIDLLADEKIRGGLPPAEARRAALADAGGAETAKEAVRDIRFGAAVDATWRDVRYALRSLAKHPVFTAAAVVTLALASGANTAILSVVDSVLLKPLNYRDPNSLVVILNDGNNPVSPGNFAEWRRRAKSFSGVGAAESWSVNLTSGDRPDRVPALRMTADVLPLLGVRPLVGRVWSAAEDQAGHDHEVVLSYAFWARNFGRDRGIVGRSIMLNGEPYTVTGVMPAGFAFAPFWATHAEVWAPLALGDRAYQYGDWSLRVFARLAPGVTLDQSRAEIASIVADVERTHPATNEDVQVVPLQAEVVGTVSTPLYVLLGAVVFVLFIACANVAHMLLARSGERQREMAVRAALGANRRRTVQQLLTESAVLALAGGAGGVLIAVVGVRLLAALGASSIPRLNATTVDARVLAAALVVAAGTALGFGLAPALRTTAVDLTDSLKEGGRASTVGARRSRFRNLLVTSEFAMALVLLVGAGLMARTFAALSAHDPGFNPRGVLSAIVSVEGTGEAPSGTRTAFYRHVMDAARSTPGVVSASMINHLPIAGDEWKWRFWVEGRPIPKPGQGNNAVYRVVMPGYFHTMRLPLVRGRDFTTEDRTGAPGVVIVDEDLASHMWPGEDPIGKRITLDKPDSMPQWLTIVGESRNAAVEAVDEPPKFEMYLPYLQNDDFENSMSGHFEYMTLVLRVACAESRTECDAGRAAGAMRREIARIDPHVPVTAVQTMDDVMRLATARDRFYLVLMLVFAVVALVLAAVGIYGVTSYAVARRTHEIGLRLALGASPGRLLARVVGEGLAVALAGAALGVLGSLALTRVLAGVLFGVSPRDPATFAIAALLLCGVAFVATYLPARRATRVAPLTALRAE
jgi:putative ABC transport system permease protein